MNRAYENLKIDIGLVAQALNNTNVTGKYHDMEEFRSVLAILNTGHMAKDKTAKLELLQAINAAAGSAKAITSHECLITANELVTELQITLATVLNTESVIINGLTFTGHTDTTTLALRQFKIDGNDTADAVAFCECVNDPTYGVPGITAENTLGVVVLTSTIPGKTLISAISGDATLACVTLKAQSYIDLRELILDAGFTHVAAKLTVTDTATWAAVALIRYHPRKAVTQRMGANYPA